LARASVGSRKNVASGFEIEEAGGRREVEGQFGGVEDLENNDFMPRSGQQRERSFERFDGSEEVAKEHDEPAFFS